MHTSRDHHAPGLFSAGKDPRPLQGRPGGVVGPSLCVFNGVASECYRSTQIFFHCETKDQLPEPITAIVTDNPKRAIYGNNRYNAIPEVNKEIRSVSMYDCRVHLSTKDQRLSNPQSIRVRDHCQKEIAWTRSGGSISFQMVTNRKWQSAIALENSRSTRP